MREPPRRQGRQGSPRLIGVFLASLAFLGALCDNSFDLDLDLRHMPTLLIRNATLLVTMDAQRRELEDGAVFMRGGVIEAVGPSAELPARISW